MSDGITIDSLNSHLDDIFDPAMKYRYLKENSQIYILRGVLTQQYVQRIHHDLQAISF